MKNFSDLTQQELLAFAITHLAELSSALPQTKTRFAFRSRR
jgi:hypothetical protein